MTDDHRSHAIAFHRKVWTLLENSERSAAEAEDMVHAAHASLAHWLLAGTAVHRQRGEWLIARVYVELRRLEPARHYFALTMRTTEQARADLQDFDLAFLAALAARVHALAGEGNAARQCHDRAVTLGQGLKDVDDRDVFFDQLERDPWFGLEREILRG
jgi:hypothetical protein